MLFNSLEFLVFFPVVTLLYWLLPNRFRWVHLLIASCIFYAAFIPAYILILFFTILIDYYAGIMIEGAAGKRRRLFLIISIIANVGILAVFKYYNFFISNINQVLHSWDITTHEIPYLNIILPIGLSFHTFQAMSYTIEVFRGHQKAERHLGIYALYVMFYPQLVAGPIERPQNLLPQFHSEHQFDINKLFDGLRLMLWGFFKKVVIADRLAIYVGAVYASPGDFHYMNLMLATLFFTIQIYCDFSGYSDIAIGAARTMGYNLMINFNRPYFSRNIQEFWKRWHISLSTWFRDYVYISLGGNRVGKWKVYRNVSVVFLLSGFWHGANWTFIIWGALHTIFIVIYMLKKDFFDFKTPENSFFNGMKWIVTFSLVAFAWIFFRVDSLEDAMTIVRHIFTLDNSNVFKVAVSESMTVEFGKFSLVVSLLAIIVMAIVEWKLPPDMLAMNIRVPSYDIVMCSVILVFIVLFGVFHNTSFIYFQF